jgi:DNA polymerase III delta prime subunit
MEQLNINNILDRGECVDKLKDFLVYFEANKNNLSTRRGVYVYGAPGTGKTYFVKDILRELNYDIIHYDAGDIRNKTVIGDLTKYNMSDKNILSMFNKKMEYKKIAIVMDEIDGMNSGDKGGINSLIKLIRPKKTKKQKKEAITMIPIICISNFHVDKKIKEMMKVCETIRLNTPTTSQIKTISSILMPNLNNTDMDIIIDFIQGDIRKLESTYQIYKSHQSLLKNKIIQNIFQPKHYNEDTKQITKKLLNNRFSLMEHSYIMNETDRTSVALLFHENIIDILEKYGKKQAVPFYIKVLKNICFADYTDRITFQKQIWIFNEMSSMIKSFYNSFLFQEFNDKKFNFNPSDVRFTKVLTKYSTEYNNILFIQKLCEQLNMDREDMFCFFLNLKKTHSIDEIYTLFEDDNYDISKLDINRIYKYLNIYSNYNYIE